MFNIGVALTLLTCTVLIIIWALFFYVTFTKEKTKNPHLYGNGFMLGITSSLKTTDRAHTKINQDTGTT